MRRNDLLTIQGLHFAYPDTETPVFSGIDLSIADGEFVALVGGSGVGKSTLLRNVAGLIAPSGGQLSIAPAASRGNRDRAFVFQDTRLLPWRRIDANIDYGLTGLGLSKSQRRDRIDEVLDLTDMSAYRRRWPHAISAVCFRGPPGEVFGADRRPAAAVRSSRGAGPIRTIALSSYSRPAAPWCSDQAVVTF